MEERVGRAIGCIARTAGWGTVLIGAAAAQTPAPSTAPVERVTVTANPFGLDELEMAQPATVLSGEDLRRRRAASIGDTLSREVGVHSSMFGPAAGRPIIRGLDGARIRVQENGIGTLDLSTISPDHAVSGESLTAERIEILRGPATLLYGSGAIGGLVNVVTPRIPQRRADGFSGPAKPAPNSGTGRAKVGSSSHSCRSAGGTRWWVPRRCRGASRRWVRRA